MGEVMTLFTPRKKEVFWNGVKMKTHLFYRRDILHYCSVYMQVYYSKHTIFKGAAFSCSILQLFKMQSNYIFQKSKIIVRCLQVSFFCDIVCVEVSKSWYLLFHVNVELTLSIRVLEFAQRPYLTTNKLISR